MRLLTSISESEFNKKVKIKFNSINDGFNNYQNKVLKSTEADYINFFKKILNLNGEENSYVDFYYNRLNDEDKQNLKSMLSKEDIDFLNKIENEIRRGDIYFNISEESIPFLVRLCTREILFSTFYFTKFPCTIWGNFQNKFPIFYEEDNLFKEYLNIASENNVEVLY